MQVELSTSQIADLARPLVGIVTDFYNDPQNEEKFQQWLQEQEANDE